MTRISKRSKPSLIAILLCLLTACLLPLIAYADCIGVVTAGGGIDFWQHVENGAIQAGKDLNHRVIVRGPMNESDAKSQALIIEQMLHFGCNALVLAPNDEQHLQTIQTLADKGIPTIFVDRDPGGARVSAIKTKNLEAGRLAGKEMAKQLSPKSKVAIFRLDPKLSTTTDRELGFLEEMNKAGIEVIVDEYIGSDISNASLKAYQLLTLHPEINGLFTPNESTTLATLNMRRRLPQGENIVHIGFDTHPIFIEEIKSGFLTAIIIQTPFHMGYVAVQHALAALQGKQPPDKLFTPAVLISKENIDTDKIKDTLAGR